MKKMIFTETQYKTHNQELIATVGKFKIEPHYFESYKYEILVFIDHNGLGLVIYKDFELLTSPRSQVEKDEKNTQR